MIILNIIPISLDLSVDATWNNAETWFLSLQASYMSLVLVLVLNARWTWTARDFLFDGVNIFTLGFGVVENVKRF